MPTKLTKKVAELKPRVCFYMAEDLRQEINGKVSAIGLYPDNVAILQIPEDMPDPSESAPLLIRSMGFLFNVSELTQETTISIELKSGGKRKSFMPAKEYPAMALGSSVNILAIQSPCRVSSFGKKAFICTVGETEHTFTFEIRKASAPPMRSEPTPQMAAPDKPKRTRSTKGKPTKAK